MTTGPISVDHAERAAIAAFAAYADLRPGDPVPGLPDVVVARVFGDPDVTGFSALGLAAPQFGARLLAFRGTDDHLDLASAVQMGVCQYRAARRLLFDWIGEPGWSRLDITGHSLGGALCQYLVYDLHRSGMDEGREIEASTFNGLGGLYGLHWLHGAVDGEVVRRIRIRHFVHPDDIIPRIGGNLGGSVLVIPDDDLDADPLQECHNCLLFTGRTGRDLMALAVEIPDRTFSIPRTARHLGPALKLVVLAWFERRRAGAGMRLLLLVFQVPAGERMEVLRLLLCLTVVRRIYRQIVQGVVATLRRRSGRPAGAAGG